MRLTLRTLLSYRDGVLPAKSHEELGQKFRDSQTAQNLAARIDKALSAPKPLESELAEIEQTCPPNEVSEFLDGTMSLDRVFSMERKCIASNAMLAELASIHSVLARELIGASKNPSSQPSIEFLARLHSLHNPKDRVESHVRSAPVSQPSPPTSSPSSPGLDLGDNPLDPQDSLNHYSLEDYDSSGANRLVLQTLILAIALAIVAWWILRDTSILPPLPLKLPSI